MSRHTAASAGLLVVLLAGCAASPADVLADRVDAVTASANARDAGALRDRADDLAETVAQQRDDGDLPAAKAARLLSLVAQVRQQADLLDPAVQARREAAARAAAEKAAAEKAAAEKAAAEKAAQEEAAREEAAQEEAAQEQPPSEPPSDDGKPGKGRKKGKDDG